MMCTWRSLSLVSLDLDTHMMKITSILIGILLTTAAFLLAQALSPNRGAHLSASPGGSSSGDVATSATETCGTVASVDVLRSTGHQLLDQAAITALQHWRFQPGKMEAIKYTNRFSDERQSSALSRHCTRGCSIMWTLPTVQVRMFPLNA
jgi:hypothetical protein